MSLQLDQTISKKYKIVEEIGQGATARVWKALEPKFSDRTVAIKELLRDKLTDDEWTLQLRRFQIELEISKMLVETHAKHVIKALTRDETEDGRPLLVMEYAEGKSLEEKLSNNAEGLSIDESIRITLDVLTGLKAFHDLPVSPVHRDVKPSNILFDKKGRAYLSDFGLCELPGQSARSIMMGGMHPSTPLYAAPEQLSSPEPLMESTDIYALGATLFEMLTGQRYKKQKPGTKPGQLRSEVPNWLDAVVMKALAIDPFERYQNAEEMAVDLRSGLEASQYANILNWGKYLLIPVLLLIIAFFGLRYYGNAMLGPEPTTTPSTIAQSTKTIDQVNPIPLVDTATSTPASTATATPSSTPDLTATPTSTMEPPATATATPEPTATATLTPTSEPTSTPTITPTPTPIVYHPVVIDAEPFRLKYGGGWGTDSHLFEKTFRLDHVPPLGALLYLDSQNVDAANTIWINDTYIGSVPGDGQTQWFKGPALYVPPESLVDGNNSIAVHAEIDAIPPNSYPLDDFSIDNIQIKPIEADQLATDIGSIIIEENPHHIGKNVQETHNWVIPDAESDSFVRSFTLSDKPTTSALLSLQTFGVELPIAVRVNGEYIGNLPATGALDLTPEVYFWIPREILHEGENRIWIGPTDEDDFMIQNIKLHVELE